MNYLAIDWGKSKIGLATGNEEMKMASPFLILKNDKNLFIELEKIITDQDIEAVVIGRPISLAGGKIMSEEFNFFIEKFKDLKVEIILEDERLSTKMAQSMMHDFKKSDKANDDAVAACVILQNYLSRL